MSRISPVCRQFLTIGCCNLASFFFGTSFGWATINFLELTSHTSEYPVSGLKIEEAAFVVSIVEIGGLIGDFAMLPICERFGIKKSLHCLGIPMILSSILLICAQNKYYLYTARLLNGLVGGCVKVGLPTLTADIAFDEIRGTLNSIYDPSFNSGLLFSFLLGNNFSIINQAKIQLFLPIIFVTILFFIPETPKYYIKRNSKIQAIKSEKFFKGPHSGTEKLDFFMKQASENVENGRPVIVKEDQNDKLAFSDFTTPQAKRAIFVTFPVVLFSFICGVTAITSYVTMIFEKTGSTMSEKTSSQLIAFVQLTTNLIFSFIVDRFNRRTLFVSSSIMTAAAFCFFGTHSLMWANTPHLEWVPPFCFSLIIFVGSVGIVPIPYILTMEIFPQKIRNVCVALAMAILWLLLFFLETSFPVFEKAFGLPACLFGFGAICAVSAVFGYSFMPETRGKSYDEIMERLSKNH